MPLPEAGAPSITALKAAARHVDEIATIGGPVLLSSRAALLRCLLFCPRKRDDGCKA